MFDIQIGVFVDRDGGRRVRDVNDCQTVHDISLKHHCRHALGDFNHFIARSRLEGLGQEMRLHRAIVTPMTSAPQWPRRIPSPNTPSPGSRAAYEIDRHPRQTPSPIPTAAGLTSPAP